MVTKVERGMEPMYLGSRTDDGPEDFDGRGPRVVRLVEERPDLSRGAWVADVEPTLPSDEGVPQTRVLLRPIRRSVSVFPEDRDSYVLVGVGPAPGFEPAWMVGLISWYPAEVAWSVEALPPMFDDRLEEIWKMFGGWLAETSEPSPPVGASFQGFPIGDRIGMVREFRRHGWLPDKWVDRFGSIPGFEWWEEEMIGWLERYVAAHGTAEVPTDLEERGRLIGAAVETLAREYLKAVERSWHAEEDDQAIAEVALSSADRERLERLPGWTEVLARVAE